MARTKITRICPGAYTVSTKNHVVSINRYEHLDYEYGQWVVAAEWDSSLYSDPIIYLADAKQCAKKMIAEATAELKSRRVTKQYNRISATPHFESTQ